MTTIVQRATLLAIPFCFSVIEGRNTFDKEDFRVTDLGDIEPAFDSFDGELFSGLLPIDDVQDSNDGDIRGELSFMFFAPTEDKDGLTVWLNGGPGCSSFHAGLLMEVSPVTTPHHPAGHGRTEVIQPLLPNNSSWTKATNLLFVEQPAGVGFSHGPMVENEEDLSYDFYNFLLIFYKTFPSMRAKKLFIVGESYGGM